MQGAVQDVPFELRVFPHARPQTIVAAAPDQAVLGQHIFLTFSLVSQVHHFVWKGEILSKTRDQRYSHSVCAVEKPTVTFIFSSYTLVEIILQFFPRKVVKLHAACVRANKCSEQANCSTLHKYVSHTMTSSHDN